MGTDIACGDWISQGRELRDQTGTYSCASGKLEIHRLYNGRYLADSLLVIIGEQGRRRYYVVQQVGLAGSHDRYRLH